MENQNLDSRKYVIARDSVRHTNSAPIPSNKRPFPGSQLSPKSSKCGKKSQSDSLLSFGNQQQGPPPKRYCSSDFDGEREIKFGSQNLYRHSSPSVRSDDKRKEMFATKQSSPETLKLVSSFNNMNLGSKNEAKFSHHPFSSKPEINCVTPDIVAALVRGHYNHLYEKYIIIDCRYVYEYEGGHIQGACNYPEGVDLEAFFEKTKNSIFNTTKLCIIFHCEFSSERAPYAYKKFREIDKKFNNYGSVTFSEIFLLEGGYKAFYTNHAVLCNPKNYRTMNDPEFKEELSKIIREKPNISESSKSRMGVEGLSRSKSNLFASYHETPAKSNKNFLFDDTPVKPETPRSNILFPKEEIKLDCEEFSSTLIFSEDQQISFSAFEKELNNEGKKEKKEKKENLRPSLRLSSSFGSKSLNNIFETSDSPFKSCTPQLRHSSSRDLFQTKSPPKDMFNVTEDDAQIISRRSLSKSLPIHVNSPESKGIEMQEDLDINNTPFRPYKPATPKTFPRYESSENSSLNGKENIVPTAITRSRSNTASNLFEKTNHFNDENKENQMPIQSFGLSQSHNSIFGKENESIYYRGSGGSMSSQSIFKGRSHSSGTLISSIDSEILRNSRTSRNNSGNATLVAQISPRNDDPSNTPYRPRTRSNASENIVINKNTSVSRKKELINEDKGLQRIRAGSSGDLTKPLSRTSSGSQLKKTQIIRQIVTNVKTSPIAGEKSLVSETDWANKMLNMRPSSSSPPPLKEKNINKNSF